MRIRFRRTGCLLTTVVMILLLLATLPCGIFAATSVSGRSIWLSAPFVGLYAYKSQGGVPIPPIPSTPGNSTIDLGFGSCSYTFGPQQASSPSISIGDTVIAVLDCEP